jgi:hypothetical protein
MHLISTEIRSGELMLYIGEEKFIRQQRMRQCMSIMPTVSHYP